MTGYRAAYTSPRPGSTAQPHIKDPEAPATEKQIAFLLSLGQRHDVGMDAESCDLMIETLHETGALTKGFVSAKIEEWKQAPRREHQQAGPGYYEYEGDLYVVVENKAKTRTYAKKLVGEPIYRASDDPGWDTDPTPTRIDWRWDFDAAKGVATRLAGATPLTEERAAEWGHLHGRCFKCLRPLTDPESVKRGMGPICAKALKR